MKASERKNRIPPKPAGGGGGAAGLRSSTEYSNVGGPLKRPQCAATQGVLRKDTPGCAESRAHCCGQGAARSPRVRERADAATKGVTYLDVPPS